MQRVCVIGAGAAGLCAARYLSAKPNIFEPVVFEKADCVGGTWVYTDETGIDKHGLPIHSSMYKNLKTNLPKEVMAFPDLPFDASPESFITHDEVKKYLEKYAANFDLIKYIKLQTVVESVKPITNGSKTQWEVTVRDLNNDKETGRQTSSFDAVIVCVGHYSVPKMAEYPGQETYTGQILHSHCYRKPEEFKNSTVVCVGAGQSGTDIVIDLHKHAKTIYFSHWKGTLPSVYPDNVIQVPPVEKLHGKTVTCTDGQSFEADHIILCTGYQYSFPFLTKECGFTVDGPKLSPVYKSMFHCDYPTLSFIGLPFTTCPFPQFACQVRLAVAALEGSYKLPSKNEMELEIKADLQRRLDMGWPERYALKQGVIQWEYNLELAKLAGVTPIPNVVENLYKEVEGHRRNNVWHYKGLNFELVDEENWRKVEKTT